MMGDVGDVGGYTDGDTEEDTEEEEEEEEDTEEEEEEVSVSNSRWHERCRSRLCRPPVWLYGAPPRRISPKSTLLLPSPPKLDQRTGPTADCRGFNVRVQRSAEG